jgi:DNA-binding GntR family transcriptional regulator
MRYIADTLAARIKQYIADENLAAGAHLAERALAERFHVSRSPIRAALRRLADDGVMELRIDDGKYVVSASGPRPESTSPAAAQPDDDADKVYFAIAEARLNGELPERVTENELGRRYPVSRSQLAAILRRMAQEGWVERLPGHGWRFLPILTSPSTYDQGYRFRIVVETAAILEPGFRLDEAALKRCEAQQLALLERIEVASPAEIFDANTRLHETIAACSGNAFFVESLRRLNSLRRLIEYRKSVDRAKAGRRCREHLELIELLLAGRQQEASAFIRRHLTDAAREKSSSNQVGPALSPELGEEPGPGQP